MFNINYVTFMFINLVGSFIENNLQMRNTTSNFLTLRHNLEHSERGITLLFGFHDTFKVKCSVSGAKIVFSFIQNR